MNHLRSNRGFTLLELTIAMAFVALLAGGIALSISTCLTVWRRTLETGDLNQEARAVIETLSRDFRGAYLGLDRGLGIFGGSAVENGLRLSVLEFSTQSTAGANAALLPEEVFALRSQQEGPPLTDYVTVLYQLGKAEGSDNFELLRTTMLAPVADLTSEPPNGVIGTEKISSAISDLGFQFYSSGKWTNLWEPQKEGNRLPDAVSIHLILNDARQRKHDYYTTITIPAR